MVEHIKYAPNKLGAQMENKKNNNNNIIPELLWIYAGEIYIHLLKQFNFQIYLSIEILFSLKIIQNSNLIQVLVNG